MLTHIHTQYTQIHIHTHTYTQTHIHTQYTQTHIHTHTYTHTHTQTHTLIITLTCVLQEEDEAPTIMLLGNKLDLVAGGEPRAVKTLDGEALARVRIIAPCRGKDCCTLPG